MKKQCFSLFIFLLICQLGFAFNTVDSVGIKKTGNKAYIVHEVEAGETLYALSRKYSVDVGSIKDANKGDVSNLSIGQRLLVPIQARSSQAGSKVHIVSSSETLFSISRLYGVKVDDLKKWNNLTENSIAVGQKLSIKEAGNIVEHNTSVQEQTIIGGRKTHVVEQSQTLYSISRMYGVSTDDLISWNNLESNALNIGQVLIVSDQTGSSAQETAENSSMLPTEQAITETTLKEPEVAKQPEKTVVGTGTALGTTIDESQIDDVEKPAEKVVQKGLAEVIEDTENTKKYLALHRDAPVGTIMQVRNEMNNQSVFVRVVGQIQATGDNSKIILKISKKAYDRLGAVDSRFPVEISYIP